MEKTQNPQSVLGKKRKRKTSLTLSSSEPKSLKVEFVKPKDSPIKIKTMKKSKISALESATAETGKPVSPKSKETQNAAVQKTQLPKIMIKGPSVDGIGEKYPILKNRELIDRFLKVPFSNNQKGRIRQAIKSQLQGSDNSVSTDVIHGKIQAILKSSENLTDSDLRRIRILYNMLQTSFKTDATTEKTEKSKKKKKKKGKVELEKKDDKDDKVKDKIEKEVNKVKGPKRYVVFLGNLPLDINKETLMKHFADIDEHIKDIRVPKVAEGKKSAIAFMEVHNEPTYEMALSKHHSMLDNRRINVMYTAQQNGKVTKSEAKGKAAKLIALRKSGKLAGSTAVTKKRSHRRNIMKRAKAKEAESDA